MVLMEPRTTIQASLSRRVPLIIGIAVVSYAALHLVIFWLGKGAPLTTAARVLCSMCTMLVAATYWSNANVRVLRLLVQRPRYIYLVPQSMRGAHAAF